MISLIRQCPSRQIYRRGIWVVDLNPIRLIAVFIFESRYIISQKLRNHRRAKNRSDQNHTQSTHYKCSKLKKRITRYVHHKKIT